MHIFIERLTQHPDEPSDQARPAQWAASALPELCFSPLVTPAPAPCAS